MNKHLSSGNLQSVLDAPSPRRLMSFSAALEKTQKIAVTDEKRLQEIDF
jgi:hypothetical protein